MPKIAPSYSNLTKVLVVDASAVVRQALSAILAREPDIDVVTAPDPVIAMARLKHRTPDAVVCDVLLPRMDGMLFVREVTSRGIPVVVCTKKDVSGDTARRALGSGAVDVLDRPTVDVKGFQSESLSRLGSVVRAAAKSNRLNVAKKRVPKPSRPAEYRAKPGFVVGVGASTGGTDAIRNLVTALPAKSPPLVIVQHMPSGFTEAFARHLDSLSPMRVIEARGGEILTSGLALVAPGNTHLLVERRGNELVAKIEMGPKIGGHRPSVNVLFESLATSAGTGGIGVLLTGMGSDGAEGLLRMRQAGALTIAQDEASCVVFGMPKSAIQIGAVETTVEISQMPRLVLFQASGRVSKRQQAV